MNFQCADDDGCGGADYIHALHLCVYAGECLFVWFIDV